MLECNLDGAVHVAFRAVGRARRAGPVGLEKRAGDVGDLETVFGEDLFRFRDLVVAQVHGVLAPHGAKLDPVKVHVVRGDVAYVIEVGGDFVVDDGDLKRGTGRLRLAAQRVRGGG